jgi:hypothetical protein
MSEKGNGLFPSLRLALSVAKVRISAYSEAETGLVMSICGLNPLGLLQVYQDKSIS